MEEKKISAKLFILAVDYFRFLSSRRVETWDDRRVGVWSLPAEENVQGFSVKKSRMVFTRFCDERWWPRHVRFYYKRCSLQAIADLLLLTESFGESSLDYSVLERVLLTDKVRLENTGEGYLIIEEVLQGFLKFLRALASGELLEQDLRDDASTPYR